MISYYLQRPGTYKRNYNMWRFIGLVIFLTLSIFQANSAVIQVQYSGQLDRMYFADCINLVNGSCDDWDNTDVNVSDFYEGNLIKDDDYFGGSFLYDTTLAYSLSSDGYQAIYSNAISDYEVSIGNFALPNSFLPRSPFGQSLSIVNSRPIGSSLFDSFFATSNFSGADWFSTSYISLQNRFGDLYTNFDIPLTSSITDFTSLTLGHAFLERSSGDQLQISGAITNIAFSQVSSVNSPSVSLVFFLLGILGLTCRRQLS